MCSRQIGKQQRSRPAYGGREEGNKVERKEVKVAKNRCQQQVNKQEKVLMVLGF